MISHIPQHQHRIGIHPENDDDDDDDGDVDGDDIMMTLSSSLSLPSASAVSSVAQPRYSLQTTSRKFNRNLSFCPCSGDSLA